MSSKELSSESFKTLTTIDIFQECKVPNKGKYAGLPTHFLRNKKVGLKIPQFFSYYLKLGYWMFLIPFRVVTKNNAVQFTSNALHKAS